MRKRDVVAFVGSGVITYVVLNRITKNAREKAQEEVRKIETETVAMWRAYQRVLTDIRRGKYQESGHAGAMVDFEFQKIAILEEGSQ